MKANSWLKFKKISRRRWVWSTDLQYSCSSVFIKKLKNMIMLRT